MAEKPTDTRDWTVVRTPDEIRRAHNLLITAILLGREASGLSEVQFADVLAYCAPLCWLCDDSYNKTFGDNLSHLEALLGLRGYMLQGDRVVYCPEALCGRA